jgi:hypothetical protein
MGAGAGQFQRYGSPDAMRPAGYQRDPVSQVHDSRSSPACGIKALDSSRFSTPPIKKATKSEASAA